MRRLFTTRRAHDDRMLRGGVVARRRRGLPGTVRRGVHIAVAAALLVATGLCLGAGGGSEPASLAGYSRPQDSSSPIGDTVCSPQGVGVTCQGTFSGTNAYDPLSSTQMDSAPPTVTVSQVTNLTHQVVNVSWANFTPSAVPSSTASAGVILNEVTVMECKGAVVNGQQVPPIYDGAYGTASVPNTCYDINGSGNSTYGPANLVNGAASDGGIDFAANNNGYSLSCELPGAGPTCGTGGVQFQVEENLQNNFLGCDNTSATPCYLVVVPNWGGDDGSPVGFYDPNYPTDPLAEMTYTADCSNHTGDGTQNTVNGYGYGTEQYWNTSCSWADRFVIPLSFAPTPAQFCSSNAYQFNSEGSPDLEQAMQQWQPAWCSTKQGQVDFDYNSGVSEYTARSNFLGSGSALTSGADMAFVTDPASSLATAASNRKFTYAPIANTGIAIAYYLDNQTTGQPVTNLKLDARLVAKLLTNSYSYSFYQCSQNQTAQSQTCDPAVAGNPTNIFHDPEFYQLNPEYTQSDFVGLDYSDDDSVPLVISGPSDMTYELTRWIESDPDAAAFLAGQPDPWGMHVNSYFKTGQTFPIPAYNAALDPGFSQTYQQAQTGPSPHWEATMQNVWNPITGQDNVDTDMLAYQPSGLSFNYDCLNPGDTCGDPGVASVYGPSHNSVDTLGARTLFAVVDTGDAGAYQFPTAQLVNSAGNAVGPTTDAMAAALASMKTNPDKITQYQDFSSTSPNAYPLTEVQYAMVPTCGLASSKVRAVSNFLGDVSSSQLIGTSTGELPAFGGYLPLTPAQQAQVQTAAQAVSSQSCTSPPPDTTVGGQHPGNNSTTTGSGTSSGGGAGGGGTPASTTPTAAGTPAGSSLPGSSPTAKPKSTVSAEPVALGMKGADDGGLAKIMLPIALVLGGLLALGGPLAYAAGTSGGISMFKRGNGAAAAGTGAGTAAAGEANADGANAGEQTPEGGGAGESAAGGTDD